MAGKVAGIPSDEEPVLLLCRGLDDGVRQLDLSLTPQNEGALGYLGDYGQDAEGQ
jgi:hypothetical protein